MSTTTPDASENLTAIYEIDGPEALARRTAERICCDQTIEAESDLLSPSLQSTILGRVEDLKATAGGRYQATIRFGGDLLSGECSDLLNVLFGTSSLRGDVTLLSFAMTSGLLSSWPGPRFGIDGLRQAVGASRRSLLCAVLKPLGRNPCELAELAVQFVEGGVDLIKDDQSLVDQQWCRFEERAGRCAETIAQASTRRGRPCLYFAHISGSLDRMRRRAAQARSLGVTGLLVAPGLTGWDALRSLRSDNEIALPIASHPAMLGTSVDRGRGGLASPVVYGLLPRLVGSDLSIYPAFGFDYPMSQQDCVSIAEHCRRSWGCLRSMMPAIGGRIGPERLVELGSALGQETIFILGSRVQQFPGGVVAAMKEFHRAL
ncbi:MAG: RuBisCO large subunit C-terminal-like domain-containing protein [Nitrospira sp.]|nr:RuBisCO large subunit C-terminal-like domain-containing protein [Nitrospira sp.]